MTEAVDCCSRCGLPIIGQPSYVLIECDQNPPKQPELWLCQPCMASLNRWLLHRQREAKDEVVRQSRGESKSPRERGVRRRRTREWHENRLKKRVRNAQVSEVFKVLRVVLLVGTLLVVFAGFVAFVVNSGSFIRKR